MARDERLTVLVLGVGGNVSQGILKAISISSLPTRVLGACISPLSLGLYRVDGAYVSPPASDAGFVPWLRDLCEREGVDAVLSGVEPVLDVLSREAPALRERTGAVCVVSEPDVLAVGRDKLLTCRWLRERGLGSPRCADAADRDAVEALVEECGYPVLAKPRYGKGAERVTVVEDAAGLGSVVGRPGFVVQELLGDDREEFTAGCFCDSEGRLRGTLVMRRTLVEGTTYSGEVGAFPDVRSEAERIVSALRPSGPCNVQLRLADGRPIAFEINVRFSGTTPVRARLGFNEVEAALRHFVLGEPATDLPEITSGLVLRYWNEMYVAPAAAEALARDGELPNPGRRSAFVEDWGLGE